MGGFKVIRKIILLIFFFLKVLHLVNISRDIVTDSVKSGRCYIPSEYMDNEEEELKILCKDKMPKSLSDKKLTKYSTKLIKLANRDQTESVGAIRHLPYETRSFVLAVTEMYQTVSWAINTNPKVYTTNAKKSKWNTVLIGLYALYIKSIYYLF